MSGKKYDIVAARPRAIVVHCSDPRFQKAFAEFLRGELHLNDGEYIPLVVSGGIGSLSEPLKLPKEFKFMKERIGNFVSRFDSLDRLILINHEDCRHYQLLTETLGRLFLRAFPTMTERQKEDLRSVAGVLEGLAGRRMTIDLYYAAFADAEHTAIVFDHIEL